MVIVTINVGGRVIMSDEKVISKIPLIEKLLSTKMNVIRDENGHIFIDRDSEIFSRILNYVRNEKEIILQFHDEEFEDECKYYGMEYFVKKKLFYSEADRRLRHYDDRYKDDYYGSAFGSSCIVVYSDDILFDELKKIKTPDKICKEERKCYGENLYFHDNEIYVESELESKDCIECFIIAIRDIGGINQKLSKYEIVMRQ